MVSVIIPTYNRAHTIGETLNSLSAQVYQDWECIIIDDGSTDQTAALMSHYVEKDPRFIFYPRPDAVSKGPNSCRNYGFTKVQGEFILWLDSDDLLMPNALHNIIPNFKDGTDAVISKVSFTDLSTGKFLKSSVISSNNLIADYLTGKVSFYISGPVWRRSYLEHKTLFDPLLSNLDDWDFNLRRIYENPRLVYLEEAAVKYRIHADSLSQEIGKANQIEISSEFRARNRHLQILKDRDKANFKVLLEFTFERYKYLLREALLKKQPARHWLFANYARMLSKHKRYFALTKAGAAFFSMSVFKKGYKLLS